MVDTSMTMIHTFVGLKNPNGPMSRSGSRGKITKITAKNFSVS